jgi:2-keto-3-deoxy-L-rhamnonate aldolase RhmA
MADETVTDTPAAQEVITAFIISVNKDGTFTASVDLSADLAVERKATVQDIKIAVNEIVDSIRATEAARATVSLINSINSQQAQASATPAE